MKKVGLIGYSFGGYETAFIVTQTGMFAAAVAGGAATDLRSYFYTVGWETGKPDMWRFENEQWNMGKTPLEDHASYEKNSPLASADNVKTPLLLWSGKKDQQVDWHQSVQYYLALRRLNKKNILLLYPDETHGFSKLENKLDISMRVQQWFSHFLKNEEPEDWVKKM